MKFCLIIFTFLILIIHASDYKKHFQSYPEQVSNSHVLLELHSNPVEENQNNENPFKSKFWVKSTNSVKTASDVNCGNHIYCELGYFCIVLTSVIFYQSFNLTN